MRGYKADYHRARYRREARAGDLDHPNLRTICNTLRTADDRQTNTGGQWREKPPPPSFGIWGNPRHLGYGRSLSSGHAFHHMPRWAQPSSRRACDKGCHVVCHHDPHTVFNGISFRQFFSNLSRVNRNRLGIRRGCEWRVRKCLSFQKGYDFYASLDLVKIAKGCGSKH